MSKVIYNPEYQNCLISTADEPDEHIYNHFCDMERYFDDIDAPLEDIVEFYQSYLDTCLGVYSPTCAQLRYEGDLDNEDSETVVIFTWLDEDNNAYTFTSWWYG